jgi:nucleotide-binding universal stress UspA family protein
LLFIDVRCCSLMFIVSAMNNILVPVDFSDVTPRVVKAAAQLAKPFGSKLILLHVAEDAGPALPLGSGSAATAVPGAVSGQLEQLQQLVGSLGLESVAVELTGPPMNQIMTQAETRRVDLIVLGTHGRGPLYHLFAGGVLDGILRRARCPVLVVPLAGEAA